ncbi:hypothetical protein BST81_10885, partial [Leptolyngbya sp. 'hensonii']|uniref:NACHT domain-containing protein n=1 Tax=Leptolyngbya sp. 'hensonii' TaxID=1922337 RepID=UPI00094FD702
MGTKIWQFIKTIVGKETIVKGVETTNAVLGLAEKLKSEGPKVQQLAPYVSQINSLLDVLNSPMAKIVGSSLPFVTIALGLLQIYREQAKREPTLVECVALVSQAAYLDSFQHEIAQLRDKPNFQTWLTQIGEKPASQSLQQRVKHLADLELDDREARLALIYFHESQLAQAFNQSLQARMVELGLSKTGAQKLVDRVARNTDRYLLPALAESGQTVQAMLHWFQVGGQTNFEKYFSIDIYLDEKIKPLPLLPVFDEPFAFKDIYVPLQAQPLTSNGERDEGKPAIDLEQWAREFLHDDARKKRIMFIQGGPGRGKSVFCRMFAHWVWQQEYPRWTPILIRLRDVRTLEKDFEETLRQAVDRDFALTDPGWLTDRNTRFLFLLDGFDELLMQGRSSGGLEEFLRQVGKFQESCADNSEKGHRVLITGRSLSLNSIERTMPANLERVEIEPMQAQQQARWFGRWAPLVGTEKAVAFQRFLADDHCPERIRGTEMEPGLAQEPLLLYLLAAMHRDGKLTITEFAGVQRGKAKVVVYEKTLDWVLSKQRPAELQQEITALHQNELRHILMEAGLCVVQAGGKCAPITMIEARLKDTSVKTLLEQARQRLGDNPLRNALATFYLQPGQGLEGAVEFAHKSFGEFLCADRIREALEDWSRPGRRGGFETSQSQMDWELYDLLGATILTPEIVEYLAALMAESTELQVVNLFQRLQEFYRRWCQGEFIDGNPATLPQQKMVQLREQLKGIETLTGQRQVNLYTGLNVLILLLELHRYGQRQKASHKDIQFYPCGKPATPAFDRNRLLQTIYSSNALNPGTFSNLCGNFLSSTNLSGADLSGADLSGVNLDSANLSEANLSGANLSGANLDSAYLYRANVSGANLSGANLSGANLDIANLSGANLDRANLYRANLYSANLSGANLSGASLY